MTLPDAAAAADDSARDNQNEHAENHGDPTTEQRARRMGWIPETEWDDDTMERRPRKFLSASEYVEKVEGDLPILRERNRFLDQTVSKLEKQLTDATGTIKNTNDKVGELSELVESLHKQNIEVGKRAYERGVAEAKAIQRRAVEEADTEAYNHAERILAELEKNKPVDPPPKPEKKTDPQPKPEAQQPSQGAVNWVSQNQKIWNDLPMKAAAIAFHERNVMSGMTEEQSFARLADQVREEFPHKFTNAQREKPPVVSTSSPPKRDEKKESFESLPNEAKQTYQRLKKYFENKGKKYSEADYASAYYLNLKETRT